MKGPWQHRPKKEAMKWHWLLLGGLIIQATGVRTEAQTKQTFDGWLVAYDQSHALFDGSQTWYVNLLIVRVEGAKRRHIPQFVTVVVKSLNDEQSLSFAREMVSKRGRWSFTGEIHENCRFRHSNLIWIDLAAQKRIPDLTSLMCFACEPDDVKPAPARESRSAASHT
jgi:hypothetical protein